VFFVRERELKDIFKIIDTAIFRLGEFLETEQIHHFAWKRKLAHIKKCTKELLEEIERF
jgi:hypothetical protein